MSTIRLENNWAGQQCKHLAPIIDEISVYHHDDKSKRPSGPFTGLIDTGADFSSVPQAALLDTEIECTGDGTAFVKYVETGVEEYYEAFYRLKLKICDHEVFLESAILWRGSGIKLGRDVLKHSTLTICWNGGGSGLKLSLNRTP